MGNKPFKIAIRLDQDVYEAGQVVKGRVYLSIQRGFDVENLVGIHLLLNGDERSDVVIERGTVEYERRRSRGLPFVDTSRHTIVHFDYPLVDLMGISRGQYEYPFELPLRDDLPASFRCAVGSERDRSYCEIRYTLTAYAAHRKNQNASSDSLLSHAMVLKMKGKPASPSEGLRPIRTETAVFPITTCWFWCQGQIALGWSSSSSVAAPGDNVQVQVWGENQSKLKVEYISVKWMEKVTWHTERVDGSGTHKVSKRLLAEQRQSIIEQNHPQWLSKRNPSSSHQALLQMEDHPPLVSTLKIPPHARESFQGRLLEVRHSIVVCAVTTAGYSSSTPELTYPVRIRRRNLETITSTEISTVADPVPPSAIAPSAPSEFYDDEGQESLVEAQALPLDWSPVQADVVSLPLASAVVISDRTENVNSNGMSNSLGQDVVVLSPPSANNINDVSSNDRGTTAAVTITSTTESSLQTQQQSSSCGTSDNDAYSQLDQLSKLVAECPENLAIVLEDPVWSSRVQQLSPRDFCKFVQACGVTRSGSLEATASLESQVARTLAMTMGSAFQTKHLLACFWMLSGDNNRICLLRDVAPLASDIRSKRSMIEEELNSQELAVFQSALSN